MKKFIITENQLGSIGKMILSERLGVPDFILDSASTLYDLISNYLKTLTEKKERYIIEKNIELPIGDIIVDEVEIKINIEEFEQYEGEPDIASMGVANRFRFDDKILMKVQFKDDKLELNINFITSVNWTPNDLYKSFIDNKIHHESILAHELKHKYDKQKKQVDLVGRDAEYQTFSSSGINFGIPVLNDFMMYSYFIQQAENLVRPTEVASRMRQKNITKDKFREFIENDLVFKELIKIKNFTYEYLIQSMKEQIKKVENVLDYIGIDYEEMSEEEMISKVLELFYINLVNAKLEFFDKMITNKSDKMFSELAQLLGIQSGNQKKQEVKRKFFNHVIKYKNREIEFFVDECEKFNYIATKMIKKIGKLYDMAPDKDQTNESIINWDLHQKIMEKKYGKRKIDQYYKF